MGYLSFLLHLFAFQAICRVTMGRAANFATNTPPNELANQWDKNAAEYGHVAGETLIGANSTLSAEIEDHPQQNDNLVMTSEQAGLNATEPLQPGHNLTADQDTKKPVKNMFNIPKGETLVFVFLTVLLICIIIFNHCKNIDAVIAVSHGVKDSLKYSTNYGNAEFPIWHLHHAHAHGSI